MDSDAGGQGIEAGRQLTATQVIAGRLVCQCFFFLIEDSWKGPNTLTCAP